MKNISKISYLILSVVAFSSNLFMANHLASAAGGYSIKVSTSGSAIADGKTALNINVFVDSGSSYMVTGYPICISSSGSGNTLSATSGATTNAYVYFTLKSSVAEAKTITVTDCGSKNVTKSVTFTAPAPAESTKTTTEQSSTKKESTSSSTTKPSSTAPQSSETAAEVKPMALSAVSINNQALPNLKDKFTALENEAIKFSGKTEPNYIVTVYVFSEPKKYTVTADANGNWQLEVTGLPAGDHHAEAELTDPKTNLVSERTKLLDFSVKSASTVSNTATQQLSSAENKSPTLKIAALGMGILAISTVLTLLVIRIFKPELLTEARQNLRAVGSKFHKTPPTPPVAQ